MHRPAGGLTGYMSLFLATSNSILACPFAFKGVTANTAVSAAWGTVTSQTWGSVLATFRGN